MLDDFHQMDIITDFQKENENDRSGICGRTIKAVDRGSGRHYIVAAAYYQI